MPNKGTPAKVVKENGKTTFYCGKNAETNKQKKEAKNKADKKEVNDG